MIIIDYGLYNGEPIIKFRLKYLNKFISVESIYTHSGNKHNGLYFDINKDIFKEYEKKLLYPIYSLPTEKDILNIRNNNILYENKESWIYEIYTRDYIQKAIKVIFKFLNPFLFFVCDVDEIPKKELYINIKIIIIYNMKGRTLKCFY
jgi:hypothetical protein